MDWAENSTLWNISQTLLNEVTTPETATKTGSVPQWYETGRLTIPLYAVIFMLAVIGNTLVILTLVKNQRMRTITNLFLLNLAVSDLLLGVLCIPFTLIGTLLRHFVFGEVMCKLLPFLQACSVSVGVWTLVAISVERYYAICHPLRSLRWQTISHAYKLIVGIWIGSLICMAPIALLSQLKPTKQGNYKCREDWPSLDYEKAYNLFLDVVLLVIPLLVLGVTYSLITRTLCKGMKTERALRDHTVNGAVDVYINLHGSSTTSRWSKRHNPNWRQLRHNWSQESSSPGTGSQKYTPGLRRTNAERSLLNKKRVIKMLFAVVLEFFICWTPLYVINTIVLFDSSVIYNNIGYKAITFFQLLAYCSSCCNPITYCFMNCGFRKSFLNLFKCLKKSRNFGVTGSEINMETKWTNRCSENADFCR
ncbi:cholecystokinin receptor [Tribolium castaneum]|uniref:Neuropeptide Y receptor-like Protein n=1 Tax=Tribolium castaneum TaxID=7070 RepID=D2A204_TRICA|nr:PREDICTED: cholecystokinin receptor [Tribolium castaneum]EFA02911.1 Neuropeptide Y receptor-like Protein [Tribolium castaneum]|eukprot:XP_972750.1 PREDICTED: cholecystokinin receptor [Tribolium castaneum]